MRDVLFASLQMDLTPLKFLSMIVSEIGNIPPHSVPVVIKEIVTEGGSENDESSEES